MADTAARLLTLLGLFQSRPDWTAAELAARTGVVERTIRGDVARLRDLGYPIDGRPGRLGGYRLGRGGRIPPLLLDESEAVAVAVALGLVTRVPGIAEAGGTVLAKLEQTLPDRLRRQIRSVHDHVDVGPVTDSPHEVAPAVSPETLTRLGIAIRDHQGLRVRQGQDALEIDPYRLVSWEERWHVVARDRRTDRFVVLRLDRLDIRTPDAGRFGPRPLPGEDYAGFVLREVAATGWKVRARIGVDAPADVVRSRINPAVGVVEAVDEEHSVLLTGADSWATVALWVGMLGLGFHVEGPEELVEHLRALGARYSAACPAEERGRPA